MRQWPSGKGITWMRVVLLFLLLLPLTLAAQEGASGYYEPRTGETVKWDFGTTPAVIVLGAIQQAGMDAIDLRVAEAEARLWQRVAEDQAEDILVMWVEYQRVARLTWWLLAGTCVIGLAAVGWMLAYWIRGMRVRVRGVDL